MICELVTRDKRPSPQRVHELLLRVFTCRSEVRLDLSSCRLLDTDTLSKLATSRSLLTSERVHLNLSRLDQLTDEVLSGILVGLGPRLVSLDVSRTWISDSGFKGIKRCTNLQFLKLTALKFITDRTIECTFSDNCISSNRIAGVGKHCHNLESLYLNQNSQLTVRSAYGTCLIQINPTHRKLSGIAKGMAELRVLSLNGLKWHTNAFRAIAQVPNQISLQHSLLFPHF